MALSERGGQRVSQVQDELCVFTDDVERVPRKLHDDDLRVLGHSAELDVKRRNCKIAGRAPRLKEILERHSDRNQQLRIVPDAGNCMKRTAHRA